MTRSRLSFPALLSLCVLVVSLPALAASSETKDQERAGATLFRDKGCTYCHGADLKGTKKAPALADIRKDKDWTPEKMTDQILNGGQKMPPFADSLSDDEIAQLVAFLRAKKRPPVPAATQPTESASQPPQ
ncbi:MAG: c-type cytochrome [Acidobacteriota bacterium]